MWGSWHPNIYVFASLSAVISGLSTALFVYYRGRATPAAKPFSLLCLFGSLWCLFPTFSSLPFSEPTVLNLARLTYIPGSFASAAYLHMAFAVSEDERWVLRHRWLLFAYGTAGLFASLSFSPYYLSGLIRFAPHFAAIGGPIYHLFVLFYFVTCGFGWVVIFRSYCRSSGEIKNRLRYFLVASVILGFSPLLHFGGFYLKSEPLPHDFLVPIFVSIVTYAIMKHHLLDIRVVVRRSLVYSILIAFITALYLIVVLLAERWFQGFLGYRSVFSTLIAAFLIAIFFNPLRNRIQAFVDRSLFQATPAELAEQREQLLAEVRRGEQMKAVGTLAAGLAHEIKNPLTAIKTFTEHLDEKFEDPGFRGKFKKIVGGEVERINLIVQQLLEFSKPIPPKLSPVCIPKLLDETLELLNSELLTHHVQVTKHFPSNQSVLGDPQQLKQVFLNLFLNSLQSMNGQGSLTLTTASTNGQVLIVIEDTGGGIPSEHLSRLGEPFFSTKPSGTGLGLAIVQNILKEHRGKIQITSEMGRGTRVEIQIPMTC